MADVKFLGTSDEVNTCECCGRVNLKSTVALSIDESDAVYFGVTCAALALKLKVADVKKGTAAADRAKAEAEAKERDAKHQAYMAEWTAFLRANAPAGHDIFTWCEALGGYRTAKDLFNAQKANKS